MAMKYPLTRQCHYIFFQVLPFTQKGRGARGGWAIKAPTCISQRMRYELVREQPLRTGARGLFAGEGVFRRFAFLGKSEGGLALWSVGGAAQSLVSCAGGAQGWQGVGWRGALRAYHRLTECRPCFGVVERRSMCRHLAHRFSLRFGTGGQRLQRAQSHSPEMWCSVGTLLQGHAFSCSNYCFTVPHPIVNAQSSTRPSLRAACPPPTSTKGHRLSICHTNYPTKCQTNGLGAALLGP